MKVVFLRDVEGTAHVGDIKDVKPGFARNFLLPRGLAAPTTKDNVQHALALAESEKRRQVKLDAEALETVKPLAGATVRVEARVGESGRLFGSVTNRDIAEALLTQLRVEVDTHAVLLPEPIRELGSRAVSVRFTRNVSAEVTVEVVPDADSQPIVERIEAQRRANDEAAAKKAAEEAYHSARHAPRGGGRPAAEPTAAEADD
jgi:large subunit ribosomal protein L9